GLVYISHVEDPHIYKYISIRVIVRYDGYDGYCTLTCGFGGCTTGGSPWDWNADLPHDLHEHPVGQWWIWARRARPRRPSSCGRVRPESAAAHGAAIQSPADQH